MSDHGAWALTIAAVALLLAGSALWWLAGRSTGIETIADAVAATAPGEQVDIAELVDRDWDELHVFAPRTPPHLVEQAVGRRVGVARGLVHDEVMLLVLTEERGRIVASGLVARTPVDWLPVAASAPYRRADAVFRVVDTGTGTALQPARAGR